MEWSSLSCICFHCVSSYDRLQALSACQRPPTPTHARTSVGNPTPNHSNHQHPVQQGLPEVDRAPSRC